MKILVKATFVHAHLAIVFPQWWTFPRLILDKLLFSMSYLSFSSSPLLLLAFVDLHSTLFLVSIYPIGVILHHIDHYRYHRLHLPLDSKIYAIGGQNEDSGKCHIFTHASSHRLPNGHQKTQNSIENLRRRSRFW